MKSKILTSYYTGVDDFQKGKKWVAEPDDIKDLILSINDYDLDGCVINNTFEKCIIDNIEYLALPCSISPYFQRWIHYYQYLRGSNDIDFAFCVDATDVQVINNPFLQIEEGIIYCGDEPQKIKESKWMYDVHPSLLLQEFFKKNGDKQILNAGVVGGDRKTLISFIHDIIKVYFKNREDFINGADLSVGQSDMGVFNYVCREKWNDKLEYGRKITNEFKSYKVNSKSWFKHK